MSHSFHPLLSVHNVLGHSRVDGMRAESDGHLNCRVTNVLRGTNVLLLHREARKQAYARPFQPPQDLLGLCRTIVGLCKITQACARSFRPPVRPLRPLQDHFWPLQDHFGPLQIIQRSIAVSG